MHQIELVGTLPTGYAITFLSPFTPGRVDAIGRVKGLYYKGRKENPPALRFSVSMKQGDPYTLHFTCDGCTDHKLMHRELLSVLQGIDLIPQEATSLPGLDPIASPQRDAKGRFLPQQSLSANQ